jgi:hypothetical protein
MSKRFVAAFCVVGLGVIVLLSKGTMPVSPAAIDQSNAFYVDGITGNDSNPGTSSSPWKTIQKAANELHAGSTVLVHAGTYDERVQVTNSGAPGAPITYRAQGTVIMHGFAVAANYIRISKFEITKTRDTWSDGPGISVSGSSNEITDNYIHDVAFYGVLLEASPPDSPSTSNNVIKNNRIVFAVEAGMRIMGANNLVEGNDISHTHQYQPGVTTLKGGDDADGIRVFGTGHIFRKNYVHDISVADPGNNPDGNGPHTDGIQTWGPAYNIVFEQNRLDIQDNGMQGVMVSGIVGPVRDLTFRNNVFVNGSQIPWGPGLNIMGRGENGSGSVVSNVTIVNNTFMRPAPNLAFCVTLHDGVQNAVVQNNAFYNCGSSLHNYVSTVPYYGGATSQLTIGYNSIFATDGKPPTGGPYPNDVWMVDPKFVDVGAKDFHLQPASPLIDAGTITTSVSGDYTGALRPQGLRYDIGVYEFVPPDSFAK